MKYCEKFIVRTDCWTYRTEGSLSLLSCDEKRLEKKLLTGIVIGNRERGKPKTRLSDNIKDMCRLTMTQVERKAQDRIPWWRKVERCAAGRSRAYRNS